MFTFDETVYQPSYGLLTLNGQSTIVGAAMPKASLPADTTNIGDLCKEDLATCFLSFLVSLASSTVSSTLSST